MRFITGEHHTAIGKDGGMQRTPKIEMPNEFNIAPIVVHHIELHVGGGEIVVREEGVSARLVLVLGCDS